MSKLENKLYPSHNISMKSYTFASFSFGCRVNQAEKEEIDRQLLSLGFRYDENNPSIYIINTCAVTQKAEREVRQFINQIRKKFPKTKIIITGCAATKWINEGIKFTFVDFLIDNVNKEYITELIKIKANFPFKGVPLQIARGPLKNALATNKYLASKRLLLKIQDGCQRFCSYCIVPYLRGTPKSKKIKEIVTRIKSVEKEIKEVILAAVNTEAYGLDTGEPFTDLIRTILYKTKIARLSFGSINPWSINKEFINLYKKLANDQRLIDYFHVPLQSGSNKILKLMNRGYTREEFAEKLNTLVSPNPLAFIGTDVIVGFLNETDDDFEDTYNFLSDSPISKFHIFRFSRREKTAAFYMAKRLKEPSEEIKKKRAKILAELGRKKYHQFLERHIGKTFPALFLDKREENYQEALLANQIPALIKTEKNLTGEIKQVKIKRIKGGKLLGKIA